MAFLGAIRPDGHDIGFMLVDGRDVEHEDIPEAVTDPPVGQHGGVVHGTGIERELSDSGAVTVHDPQRFRTFLVVFLQVSRSVTDKHNAPVRKIHAGNVVERSIGQLHGFGAIRVDLAQVEPVLTVTAHAEEDLLAIIGNFGIEHRPLRQVGDPSQPTARFRRNQCVEVPPRPRGRHGSLHGIQRRSAVIDVAFPPIASGVFAVRVGIEAVDVAGNKDDARQRLLDLD